MLIKVFALMSQIFKMKWPRIEKKNKKEIVFRILIIINKGKQIKNYRTPENF
jgi:hypothetical protein